MTTLTQLDTRLNGKSLTYARLVWTAIAFFYVGSFMASLPVTLSHHAGFVQQSQGWTEADIRSSLAQLGISFGTYQNYDTWSNLIISFVFFGLGLFIFWRRSDDWMALLFSVFFLTFPGSVVFGTLVLVHPVWKMVQAITDSLSSINIVSFLIFPDGSFIPRWTRWVALGYAGVQVWRLFRPDLYQQIGFVLTIPLFLCIILSQIYRYRRVSTLTQRQQTKWVVYGLVAGITPLLVYLLVYLLVPEFSKPGALGMAIFLLGNLLWSFTLVCIFLSVTLAILRYRLWDIGVIIQRTLVWSTLTIMLGLVYFGGVTLLQSIFSAASGQRSAVAIVLSTLAIAALFNPLRKRIQEFVDRRFYRRKYNAEEVLASFSALARQEVDLEEIKERLIDVVEGTVQPEHVSLWLKPIEPPKGVR